jgi:hypothetical protein
VRLGVEQYPPIVPIPNHANGVRGGDGILLEKGRGLFHKFLVGANLQGIISAPIWRNRSWFFIVTSMPPDVSQGMETHVCFYHGDFGRDTWSSRWVVVVVVVTSNNIK